jgi:hypothetical protein
MWQVPGALETLNKSIVINGLSALEMLLEFLPQARMHLR